MPKRSRCLYATVPEGAPGWEATTASKSESTANRILHCFTVCTKNGTNKKAPLNTVSKLGNPRGSFLWKKIEDQKE